MNKRLDLMETVDAELRDSTMALLKRLSELSDTRLVDAKIADGVVASARGALLDESRLISA